jgi:hypothetical protein
MNKSMAVSEDDLVLYLEGYIDSPTEIERIESAIRTNSVTRMMFLLLAEELSSEDVDDDIDESIDDAAIEAGIDPPTVTEVRNEPAAAGERLSLFEPWRLILEALRAGQEPPLCETTSAAAFRQVGGYAPIATLHGGAEELSPARAPVEYERGYLSIDDDASKIPFGVVQVVVNTLDEPQRYVQTFLLAVPLRDQPEAIVPGPRRQRKVILKRHLADNYSPTQVEPRVIAARETNLSLFPAHEVRELLSTQEVLQDPELQATIEGLLKRLEGGAH